MASELQVLVNALGRRLQRSVAVDDTRMALLAHSSHFGVADDARRASILERQAPPEAVAWAKKHGVDTAEGPVRLPGRPDLNMLARVCIPIRSHGVLLGYLWLLDEESALTDEDIAVAERAGMQMGVVLHREQLLGELLRSKEGALLRDLLNESAEVRSHAAGELVDSEMFASGPVVAIVVHPVLKRAESADEAVRVALGQTLDKGRRLVTARHALQLLRHDHAVLMVATRDPNIFAGGLPDLARQLHEEAVRRLQGYDSDWSAVVGVGEQQDELADAVASYRQAVQAVRVAQSVRSVGQVVTWRDLGIYRVLSQVPVDQLTKEMLHPGLVRLLERREKGEESLLETLDTYLEHGGDAHGTSAALCIHRATLYYRLHKIEDLAGLDLKSGEDRLSMHLSLKLARLAGLLSLP